MIFVDLFDPISSIINDKKKVTVILKRRKSQCWRELPVRLRYDLLKGRASKTEIRMNTMLLAPPRKELA